MEVERVGDLDGDRLGQVSSFDLLTVFRELWGFPRVGQTLEARFGLPTNRKFQDVESA
jgi:hypothetical protein